METHTLTLNTGAIMPILGFGTSMLEGDEGRNAIMAALAAGYRHIDTADHYGNHREIADAIAGSGIPREEIFITTKIWRTDLKRDAALAAGRRFLEELNTSYVDLLLMHYPDRSVPMTETLGALEELRAEGVARAIGVSNFTTKHIAEAARTGITISANQVEFHPSLYQKGLKEFCDSYDIRLIAFSPIAQGADLKIPLIVELAGKYACSPAQICLAWIMSKRAAAIPRADDPKYIEDNFKSLDVRLSPEDVERIDGLGLHNRVMVKPYNEYGDEL